MAVGDRTSFLLGVACLALLMNSTSSSADEGMVGWPFMSPEHHQHAIC